MFVGIMIDGSVKRKAKRLGFELQLPCVTERRSNCI